MAKRININENWMFLKESCDISELPEKDFEEIQIPHTWNAVDGQDGGDDYHRGLCWYKKIFTGEKPKGDAYIEFEAVNSVANVYLNGTHLGEHRGGYSRFRFDITDLIEEGENTLLVSADNRHFEDVYPLFADFTFYGGIYRDVSLVYCAPVHFEMMDFGSDGVFIKQKEVTREHAKIEVTAKISGSGKNTIMTVKVMDTEGNPIKEKSLKCEGNTDVTMDIDIENPRLWDGVKDPYLHIFDVTLAVDGTVMDSISIPTGFRYFEFDCDRGLILNGEHVRLNGVSRHQDREGFGNAISREHQIQDMELIKEVGANSIRLAHYQHNRFFYDLCDARGMVVWAEIPYISRVSDLENYSENAISQMRELIRQNYNHSSIIMWGVQNEIGLFPQERPLDGIVREINAVVKEEDPTRATTQAQVAMIDVNDPANRETDIVGFNHYYGWYIGDTSGFDDFIKKFRQLNPDVCLAFSEYGAEGILKWHSDTPEVRDYTEEYHAGYHEEAMAIFNRYGFIWGTYVWNMFDFGSDMRDEGGVKGRNNKGLVTFDRKTKKDAFFFYKSIWSKEPMVHITSKRFVKRHKRDIKIKVYSNLDEVTLYLNGEPVGIKKCENTVFTFNIRLNRRKNVIVAQAGDLKDSAIFIKVRRRYKGYVLPDSETKKGFTLEVDGNIKNWFEKDGETPEMEFPEGYFTIKDSPKEILENDQGRAYLEENFKQMIEHPMFKRVSKMSLEKIFKFLPDTFPETLVYRINSDLNKIRKG